MTRCRPALGWFAAVLCLAVLSAVDVPAQLDWAWAHAEAHCSGSEVVLAITIDVYADPPAEITGWLVDREVVGACVPAEQVGGIRPLPSAIQHYVITDVPDVPDRKAIYRIYAVDVSGTRHVIPWTQRTMFAEAACHVAPAARGTVREIYLGHYILDVCSDQCWWSFSEFEQHLPSEAPALVGQQINVYGTLYWGMHGPAIDVSGWDHATRGCAEAVGLDPASWGTVKATYR